MPRVFISYKHVEPDASVARALDQALTKAGHQVFIDGKMAIGTDWGKRIQAEIGRADAVVFLLSAESVDSEMVIGEVQVAHELKKSLLPVRLAYGEPLEYPLSAWLGSLVAAAWEGPSTTSRLAEELTRALAGAELEPEGEVMALARFLDPPYRDLPAEPSFAELLDAGYGALPFRGLDEPLEQLRKWCLSESRLAMATITAPGGYGKTRLAAELCSRLTRDRQGRWTAGFLKPLVVRAAIQTALLQQRSPALVVIDDASRRVGDIAALLLAAGGGRTRILLLDRQAGEWWKFDLWSQLHGPAKEAYERAWLLELPVAVPTEEDRRRTFHEAGHLFAARKGLEWSNPSPVLDAETYDSPLFLQLAALLCLSGEDPASSQAPARSQLLASLLRRERAHWLASAAVAGLEATRPLIDRLMSVFVLTRVESEDEGIEALQSIPDLAGAGSERLCALLRWARTLYQGSNFVPALSPDLLGEALLNEVLQEDPDLATRLLRRSTAKQADFILGRLMQLTATAPDMAPMVARTFKQLTPSLIRIAVGAAVRSTSAAVPRVLADVYESLSKRDLADARQATRIWTARAAGHEPPASAAPEEGPIYAPAMRVDELRVLAKTRSRQHFVDFVGPFVLVPCDAFVKEDLSSEDLKSVARPSVPPSAAGPRRRIYMLASEGTTVKARNPFLADVPLHAPEQLGARQLAYKLLLHVQDDLSLAMPFSWVSRSQPSMQRDQLSIGRGDECDLIVRKDTISKVHALIRPLSEWSFEVEDLKSTNGTWVNEAFVPATRIATIVSGDILMLGEARFYLFASTHVLAALTR